MNATDGSDPRGLRPHAPRVLLVSRAPAPPAWTEAGFALEAAPSVTSAARRLAHTPADVVVLDAPVPPQEEAGLADLRERLGHAALLVRAPEDTPGLQALMRRLGAGCLVPAQASPALQEQLIQLAAEHARLGAALARRVAELELRTGELEASRARFRDVIERNADAIVVVDAEGSIRFANSMAATLFHSSRERLCGTSFGFPVLAGETTELDLVHEGDALVLEMRVVESEWEGQPAFIASLRDITERKRAEEGARTLIREQAARGAAEAAAQRFRFLAEAGALLSFPLDVRETLATLAQLCVRELADWAVVYLVDDRRTVYRLQVAHRDPAKAAVVRALRDQPISPEGGHPVLEVLRTRTPLLATQVDEEQLPRLTQDAEHLELARTLGVASFMLIPMVARERELGAIALVSSDPGRRYTPEDLALAGELALRAALAADNARLFRQAKAANQAKTDLLAVISHDLRTPLNAIIGHAELLAMGIPDALSEAGLERVGRIRTAASHLVYLIDELLAFSRLDSGREAVRVQEVDVCAVSRELATMVEPLAAERGLTFHLALPDGPLALRTDPDRLRQVLLNLVGNGVKYTPAGEVSLEVEGAPDRVVFRVRDTGIGIAAEHLDRIFEPFWQADPTQRSRNGGTGLGLSVVHGLIRLLGGEISVESEPGRGSTFTVRLPADPPAEPHGEEAMRGAA